MNTFLTVCVIALPLALIMGFAAYLARKSANGMTVKRTLTLNVTAFAVVLNLGFVLFSAQLPLVTGNLHSVADCALIGLALSAFRSESILRDTAMPVFQAPKKETA